MTCLHKDPPRRYISAEALGDSENDSASAIAIDSGLNVYVTGDTTSNGRRPSVACHPPEALPDSHSPR